MRFAFIQQDTVFEKKGREARGNIMISDESSTSLLN